ncbi:peptide chain release factor N(5)-glutamine methyltransferase [Galbibacter sp. EGI 63066]|uniref:peptide chain release factor N(5)-glutamine methyltransferase n=1 Tax=Galbibacter sp. EGI 63066 TaxID=2993559 RepID=UPI00224948DD|nr:peptide chain release factor N(5)-glutamine methyltransferase [Galbibacter sp. EGI 63066]MCX2681355.1 peptide chain release factor N(5)-glutamine methyltransferase [Galbibacter sp. EGI 63066]
MTLNQLKSEFTQTLSGIYEATEISTFFKLLCESYMGLQSYQITQNLQIEVEADASAKFQNALAELKTQKPIQHILGKAYFYGLGFLINEHTLIPRPETEELVDWIIKDTAKNTSLKILDIGTGSGCIAVSLAKNRPDAEVYAVDVSDAAIAIAKENAKFNKVNVNFREVDILSVSSLSEIFPEIDSFDIVVSNPPYVRNLEKQEIKDNVLGYEPTTALFVYDDNPLIFYKKIAQLASGDLKKDGILYFEINQYLGKEMLDLIAEYQFQDTKLKKDLFKNDRMLRARKA